MENLRKISNRVVTIWMVLSGVAYAQGPDNVRINSLSYAGSGCAAGTVAGNLSPDGSAFSLIFDSFVAETGPGIRLSTGRKNCTINVDLDFPGGWSYSLMNVDYRGFVELDPGATAEQKSMYYFQGDAHTASLSMAVRGPLTRDYQIRDSLGLEALVWSPCGARRSLNINTQVRTASLTRAARGLITIDSIDAEVTHIYGIRWRRCR